MSMANGVRTQSKAPAATPKGTIIPRKKINLNITCKKQHLSGLDLQHNSDKPATAIPKPPKNNSIGMNMKRQIFLMIFKQEFSVPYCPPGHPNGFPAEK